MLWLLSPRGEEKSLALIQSYFDESGIHGGSKLCVVAGYVGTVTQWSKFECLWESDANAPGFHGREFFDRNDRGQPTGIYAGWGNAQCDAYLNRLLSAIWQSGVLPIGTMVDVEAFHSYSEDERRYLTGGFHEALRRWRPSGAPSKPYYVGFLFTLLRVLDDQSLRVAFTFDQQKQMEAQAHELYNYLKGNKDFNHSGKMGALVFESRDQASPLQAADMLAHAWYRYGSKSGKISEPFQRILGTQRSDLLGFVTKDVMEKMLGNAPPTPGITMTFDN